MNAIAHASAVPVTGPKLDGRRVRAGIIDLVVVLAGALGLGVVVGALGSDQPRDMPGFDFVVLGWALYYYFACESSSGQTLGKRLMKLRVVRLDGSPAGMGEVAVRTVLRVIDGIAFYLVGLIVMLVTGERRGRLGDLAARTMVVDASAPVAPAAAPAAVEEPAREEPAVASSTITLPPRPVVEEPQPVVEEPQPEPVKPELPLANMASPSLQELAQDVAELRATEPQPEQEPQPEPEPVAEEPVTVTSVETVSAIDLVMGADDDDDASDLPSSPQR
ncbi:MAG TPA: RDD family protein [Thermoleophilaceae bacterium]|nr:RDD family protein [Thermoleophilaceae bacterium]